jgi:hypothetical protein
MAQHVAVTLTGEMFLGIYRETGPKERADFIEQVDDNIDALGDELVERVQLDTGIVEVDGERLAEAHELYLREGLGTRDDAAAMQYLVPGWTFDPKRPALRREGTTP